MINHGSDAAPLFPSIISSVNQSESTTSEIDMDREELRAHLENQDLKVDARLKSFEQTVKDAMAEIRLDSANVRGEIKAMHVELGHLKNIKGSIWGAAGATIIGVGGILTAMLSYGVANYDTARENTDLVAQAKAQVVASQNKVDKTLEAMNKQLEEAKKQSAESQKLLEEIRAHQAAPQPRTPPSTKGKG